MKSNQGLLGRVPAVLFLATGVFWAAILATGGGAVLVWAALTCFASAAFLLAWSSNWATRPLTIASALFGLTLTIYQIYISLTIVGTALGTIAAYSGILFAVFSAVYLYLLFVSLTKA